MTQPGGCDVPAQESIGVFVDLRAKPGHANEVEAEARAIFERIRREEPGCQVIVGYRSDDDPEHFQFYEEWRDRAEFLAFRDGREYMQEYFARLAEHTLHVRSATATPFA